MTAFPGRPGGRLVSPCSASAAPAMQVFGCTTKGWEDELPPYGASQNVRVAYSSLSPGQGRGRS